MVAMRAPLALLSLLGACSGMLDMPDQPRVSTETTAPLQPSHDPHEGAGAWREPRAWPAAAGTTPAETLGASTSDAGVDEMQDGGIDVRLSSG